MKVLAVVVVVVLLVLLWWDRLCVAILGNLIQFICDSGFTP
ncbi:hypothetical protein [Verrucomicrobium spinosum]|nr:hypothetical protein [Verrucomicrobium spinosum]